MNSEYVANGKVKRGQIVSDILNRKIKKAEIEVLCKYPEIQENFVGSYYSKKRPKNEWNKKYLERLSFVAGVESFNKDYLLYLDEVAEHVTKQSLRSKIIIGIAALIIGIVVIKIVF